MENARTNRTRPLVFVTNGDGDFLLAMQQLLEDEGYTPVVMELIDDPYPTIARLLPDLLVIDFPYQEMLAWDLLDRLDANPETWAMPMIATSTDRENLDRFAARTSHRTSTEIQLKPFDLEPLLYLIAAFVPVGEPETKPLA